jgi:hypothetical protein
MGKRRATFILRVWWDEEEPDWIGQVQQVGAGESALVRSIGELLAFIEQWTGKLSIPDQRGLK